MASPDPIDHHVAAIDARTSVENERLAYVMLDRAWPGGMADFRSVIGSAWLSRWRPLTDHTVEMACSCPAGRCAACN